MVPEYWNNKYEDASEGEIFSVVMSTSRSILFALIMLALAMFATIMAFWPPRGHQPVAWGHVQTLADLVDDWGDVNSRKGKLWWGDKNPDRATLRHAGTSGQDIGVGKIHKRCEYAG